MLIYQKNIKLIFPIFPSFLFSYPRGAPLQGRVLALLVNIRQGWKGLSGTKALGCWAHLQVTKKIKCCEYVPRPYRQTVTS